MARLSELPGGLDRHELERTAVEWSAIGHDPDWQIVSEWRVSDRSAKPQRVNKRCATTEELTAELRKIGFNF